MHRRDHRLVRILDKADHGQQRRLRNRLGRVELSDIGATRKGPATASEHDSFDRGVGERLLHAVADTAAKFIPQTVHRRVLHRDQGEVAADGVIDLVHCESVAGKN